MPVLGFVETALLVLDFAIKLIAIGVVPEGRHPSSGNAWLLLILFVPLVGLPLYLLLGSPYVNRRRKLIQREANKSLGEGLSHPPDVTPEAHPTPALASILRMNRSFTGLPCLTGRTSASAMITTARSRRWRPRSTGPSGTCTSRRTSCRGTR